MAQIPSVPSRRKEKVKKVTISAGMIETLDDNDVVALVNGHLVPIAIDSGAKMSIVPQEFVEQSDFVGEILTFKGVLQGTNEQRHR